MKFEHFNEYSINGRFALNPAESAMQNLCRAMDLAVLLVLTRKYKRLRGLDADTWAELRDEVYLAAVVHFIHHKVRQHKYNRNYDFLQNCISSAWSVAGNKVNQLAHARYLPNAEAVYQHMMKHAAILRPKFEECQKVLNEELAAGHQLVVLGEGVFQTGFVALTAGH